ncbi:MAG TPA: serine/threonine-protein kinase [Humisphaera sp.]|jgi:serine/threonine protein kinase|nr:serine/threonine-protein kinase [Humisphaera sp.]
MASSIRCPLCRHIIELKGVKPGRFHPACPACKERFVLVVPTDPTSSPRATVLAENARPEESLDLTTVAPEPEPEPVPEPETMPEPVPPPVMEEDLDATLPPDAFPQEDYEEPPTAPPPSRHRQTLVSARPTKQRDLQKTVPPVGLSEGMTAELSKPSPYAAVPADPLTFQGKLGGYQILKKLGQGGMGAVYLAKQISLDRNVALKVLAPRLAEDPHFVSRFTREAFAAAQLAHHNVVQIHDIGVDEANGNATNYFSMEFVPGKTLAGVVREAGKVDPEAAVGFVLQAARGLKFAHDHGLIHRDVKPDNLLLNDQGVVKVADLGLVKRTGQAETLPDKSKSVAGKTINASQTQTSVAMGTPAYMPPEQAKDAATVDPRADIYSLGCTLYDMLTGHPPFSARTAAELMTKHAKEAVVPPDRIDRNVPGELSRIVMKMVAKKPEERYGNMAEVITALEGWLGVESGRAFTPKQEHVKLLEASVDRFEGSKYNVFRKNAIRAFFAVAAILMIIFAIPAFGRPEISAGIVGCVLATIVFYEVIHGVFKHSYLMGKVRQAVFDSRISDWITYVVVTGLVITVLVVFGLIWTWLLFAVLAAGAALVFYFTIDVSLTKDRETSLLQTEKMLREMRLAGLDENSLRQFVCKYSGKHWEEFYENLFGFEAKMQARQAWGRGERARNRPRYGAWREPIIAWIDRRAQTHQEERSQKMLTKLESASLQAQGVDQIEANRKARKQAERLVQKAAAVREAAFLRATDTAVPTAGQWSAKGAAAGEAIAQNWMHDDSPPPRGHSRRVRHSSYLRRRYGSPIDILTGRLMRFVIATMLLVGFGTWWNANGGSEFGRDMAGMLGSREDPTLTAQQAMRAFKSQRDYQINGSGRIPLRVEHVPEKLCDGIGSWGGALAGGLLLVSIFFAGRLLGLGVMLASSVAMLGPVFNLPLIGSDPTYSAGAAIVLWLVCVIFFRGATD